MILPRPRGSLLRALLCLTRQAERRLPIPHQARIGEPCVSTCAPPPRALRMKYARLEP